MIRIRDESLVKQWVYRNPEDGFVISHFGDVNATRNKAKIYRRANNYPVGADWNAQFERILCENLPVACEDFTPPTAAEQAASLARALYGWAKQGFPTRSNEEVERILAICRDCSEYGGETGPLKIICRLCHCSRRKVYLKSEQCPMKPPKWT